MSSRPVFALVGSPPSSISPAPRPESPIVPFSSSPFAVSLRVPASCSGTECCQAFSRRVCLAGLYAAVLTAGRSFVPATAVNLDEFEEDEERVVHLFEGATRSVVCIKNIELSKSGSSRDSSFKDEEVVEGTGSGFVWDQYGHIVTNYHVVAKMAVDSTGKQQVQVSVLDPSNKPVVKVAKLVGVDAADDLAVLKIDVPANWLQPMPLGSSKDLKVGQSCYAIGNPYGYEHTLTSGVISGVGREIPSPAGRPIGGCIQTDAAINAGNSGGPLLDSFGHVIGVSTATFTRQGSGMSSGVNFAIPIDLVLKLVPYLIVDGTIGY